ncbi:MAG: M48 family metallopeptidase [Patescibacteria group bacterium]|nr:M48 family metallopeptidase [Patescibacteria group bacterium]MDE2172343.1 M48 family metallopeptidase [Patescibacteria group bacterium]
MAVFLAFAIAVGYFISYYYDSPGILVAAVIFALAMNIASYWYSDRISLSLAGAVPAEKARYPELHEAADILAISAGLPTPALYVINDAAPNAFATGRDKNHAAIAVTTGLLGMMTKDELIGVLAHEFSHIGNRDTLLMTVVVVLVGFIAILANIFTRSLWWGGGRRGRDREEGGQIGAILAVVGIIFVILSPIVAQLIQLAISRKREFLADADGALLTRYPEGLAAALEKIQAYDEPMARANNATAHLFIANPFGAHADRGLARLFMTHPPLEERIAILRGRST